MIVTHSVNLKEIQRNVENPKLMLTNKSGGFLLLGASSRYNGFFFYNGKRMFRTLEHIEVLGDSDYEELINHFSFVERRKGTVHEYLFLPPHTNSLVYELNRESDIMVALDVKEAYDNREFGRYYEVEEIRNGRVFKFIKRTDMKEDKTHEREEYTLYFVVYCEDMNYSLVRSWVKRKYWLWSKSRLFLSGMSVLTPSLSAFTAFLKPVLSIWHQVLMTWL